MKNKINISLDKTLQKQISSHFLIERIACIEFLNSIIYSEGRPQLYNHKGSSMKSNRTEKSINKNLEKFKNSIKKESLKGNKEAIILHRNFSEILPVATKRELSFKRGKPVNRMRFRDWNPDVKWAIRRGVNIVYSSHTNEIVCPSLGISSSTVSSQGSYSGRSVSSGARSIGARARGFTRGNTSGAGNPKDRN